MPYKFKKYHQTSIEYSTIQEISNQKIESLWQIVCKNEIHAVKIRYTKWVIMQ